jgi:hypothetical protein
VVHPFDGFERVIGVSGVCGIVPCGGGHHDRVEQGLLAVAECVLRIGQPVRKRAPGL